MKLETFFEKFDLFAEIPGAVEKMRELVLSLATQGKLVPQIQSEGRGQTLLDDICRAVPSKALQKLEESIESPFEGPAALPDSWARATLGEVATIIRGVSFPGSAKSQVRSDGDIACLRTASVQEEIDWHDLIYISPSHVSRSEQWVAVNDIMISMANSYALVGKVAIVREVPQRATFGAFLAALRPIGINPFFLLYVLRSRQMQEAFRASSSQTTNIANISLGRMRPLPFPVPPLAEQKRIVAKVDELMALCDQLEAQHNERETRHAALARASLSRFAAAPSRSSLSSLFHPSFSITPAELRKAILALAIKGKLVPQNVDEEPASDLLKRVAKQRAELLSAGYPNRDEAGTQLRKQESHQLPSSLPTLPSGWEWATLLQLSLLVVDCHNKTAPYSTRGVRLLRTTNIRNGRLNSTEPRFVHEETYLRWSARCPPEPGDLLITREAPMGEVCIIPDEMRVCLGQRMMLLRLVPGTIDKNYLLYSLMAPDLMERVQDKPVGATVQHLRVGGVETLLTPLPPLQEQQRIVEKIEALLALVDKLESDLMATRAEGARLLNAALEDLTECRN